MARPRYQKNAAPRLGVHRQSVVLAFLPMRANSKDSIIWRDQEVGGQRARIVAGNSSPLDRLVERPGLCRRALWDEIVAVHVTQRLASRIEIARAPDYLVKASSFDFVAINSLKPDMNDTWLVDGKLFVRLRQFSKHVSRL